MKFSNQGNEYLLRRACLANKFDVDLKDSEERTLFFWACTKAQYLDICKFLVSLGANINSKAKLGKHALHLAVDNYELPVIRYLFEELNIDPNVVDQLGRTSLHIASRGGNFAMVKYLIDHKASVDIADRKGFTPLLECCRWSTQQTLEIVELLIANKADIKAITNDRETVLHLSCAGNSFECVKYLLDAYGLEKLGLQSLETTDMYGQTLLWHACRWGLHDIAMNLIKKNGANIKAVTLLDETIFFAACEGGKESIVRMLITKGVDKTRCNKEGRSPFCAACKANCLTVVRYLAQNQNFLDLDKTGMNGLHCACSGGALDVVRYLIKSAPLNTSNVSERTALLEIPDAKDRTSLYFAATGGHADTVKFLLKREQRLLKR